MATDLYYNGVILHNVTTREFSQQTVYDVSGTDQLCQHFSIRVDGIIHLQSAFDRDLQTPWTAHQDGSTRGSLEAMYQRVRAYLSQPRGALLLQVSDPADRGNYRTLFRCVPTCSSTSSDADRDVGNGPKPGRLEMTAITGSGLFRISFSIECDKAECAAADQGSIPRILNNRWSIEESLDENFFTTRTISGQLRLSVGAWQDYSSRTPELAGVCVEAARRAVVPILEAGFKRMGVTFHSSPDGLTATYTVTDRQVHTSAPWPATSITGHFSESTTQQATIWMSEGSVTLTGAPTTDKKLLMCRAMEVLNKRLELDRITTDPQDQARNFVEAATLSEVVGEEVRVTASARIRRTPSGEPAAQRTLVGTMVGHLGQSLEPLMMLPGQTQTYDSTVSPTPALYGYDPQGGERRPAVLFLLSCFLQAPCSDQHSPGAFQNRELVTGHVSGDGGAVLRESSLPLATQSMEARYSPGHQVFPYTYARASSRYLYLPITATLPVASAVGDVGAVTAVVVKLGQGVARREIFYQAERIGAQPSLPAPLPEYTDGNLHGTLLGTSVEFAAPTYTPDGKLRVYRSRSRTLYALDRPPTSEEAVRTAVLPFSSLTPADTAVVTGGLYDTQLQPGDPFETELVQ